MVRNFLVAFLFCFIFQAHSFGQEAIWKAGFYGFFDNREYFNPYAAPQSILGSRIFAEGGFKIYQYNEFGAGVDYLFEFGSEPNAANIKPILYYHHLNGSKELYMGAFPRRDLIETPNVLLNDTFNYYRPNIEGIYLKFSAPWGYQTAFLDWTSRQTLEAHETFIVSTTSRVNKGAFFSTLNFLMYHFAGTAAEGPSKIRDNGGLTLNIGADLSKHTFLDSLSVSTGLVGSYDRQRGEYDLRYAIGSKTDIYLQYNNFGVRSMMYLGQGQDLMVGDKMYLSPIYNRTDLIYNVFSRGKVKGAIEFSLHFLPSKTDFSQKFTIYLDISGSKKLK